MPKKKSKSSTKKNFLRQVFELDCYYNRVLEKAIKANQALGDYPDHFEFPIGLQYELTTKCNLKCKHCYNYSGENTKEDRMTPEDWLALSKHIVKHGGLFECIISGGEPLLLGDKLLPIMDTFHEDGSFFVFITNGFLLDKEWAKKLKKYLYDWFQISIDGHTPDLHDEFRGVKGSFEKAVKAVFHMANEGIHVRIAHSVSRANMNYLDEMAELAYNIGASSIIMGESSPSGRGFLHRNEIELNQEEYGKVCKKMNKLTQQYEGRMEILRSSFTKIQLKYYQIQPTGVAIIRPDGNVRLDCMAPFVMGNVKERPFVDIWREKSSKCWQDKRVVEYVNSIRGSRSESSLIRNYVDKDVFI